MKFPGLESVEVDDVDDVGALDGSKVPDPERLIQYGPVGKLDSERLD